MSALEHLTPAVGELESRYAMIGHSVEIGQKMRNMGHTIVNGAFGRVRSAEATEAGLEEGFMVVQPPLDASEREALAQEGVVFIQH